MSATNKTRTNGKPPDALARVALWVEWAKATLADIEDTAARLRAANKDPDSPLYGRVQIDELNLTDDGVTVLCDVRLIGLAAVPDPLAGKDGA